MSDGMRLKAEIITIGTAWLHEPDEDGHTWTAEGWEMSGGDFPEYDASSGECGGWTFGELAMLVEMASYCGDESALDVARECRSAPPAMASGRYEGQGSHAG